MAQCQYKNAVGEECPHDAVAGVKLCIFHVPANHPAKPAFWKHLATYLYVLLEKAGNAETEAWSKDDVSHWVFAERDGTLLPHFYGAVQPGRPWDFDGFVFPSMDDTHNFDKFVFSNSRFDHAKFLGKALFAHARFQGKAGFFEAKFGGYAFFHEVSFSADAVFAGAEFSADVEFAFSSFGGKALFIGLSVQDRASFSYAKFASDADFEGCRFKNGVHFTKSEFLGTATFINAHVTGVGDFSGCKFTSDSGFEGAAFGGMAVFSYARFTGRPSFAAARFGGGVDFHQAKIPGLGRFDDERTARNLRRVAEHYGSYADAGEFYLMEMEFRRRRFMWREAFFTRLVMEVYKLVSKYGESPVRALVFLLGLVVASAAIYPFTGFRFPSALPGTPEHVQLYFVWAKANVGPTIGIFLKSLLFALGSLIPGFVRPQDMGPTSAQTVMVMVIQATCGAGVLALFLLAIRRRFSREV